MGPWIWLLLGTIKKCCILTVTLLFSGLGMKVVLGQRFSGGFVRDQRRSDEFIKQIKSWVELSRNLPNFWISTWGHVCLHYLNWYNLNGSFIHWVVPHCANYFSPLCDSITELFWLSVLGGSVSKEESKLLFLLTHMARIWICNPTRQNQINYLSSRAGTSRVTVNFERQRDVLLIKSSNQAGLLLIYNKNSIIRRG